MQTSAVLVTYTISVTLHMCINKTVSVFIVKHLREVLFIVFIVPQGSTLIYTTALC